MLGIWETIKAWLMPSASTELPGIVTLAIFLCALCLAEGLYLYVNNRNSQDDRKVKERLKFVHGLEHAVQHESLLKKAMVSEGSWHQRLMFALNRFINLEDLLLQADVAWSVTTLVAITGIFGFTTLCLGYLKGGLAGAAAGFCLGAALPFLFLVIKKKRRLKAFEKQFPEALGLIARSLKAGHSFPAGLQLVADEMANPIGIEFFKTFKEYNYGLDLNVALMNLYHRIKLRDLKFFITAVVIQRETGGNLVEILEKISSLIRERFKLINQVKALTSEGRFSGLILILLPPVIGGIMFNLNQEYIMTLFTHPLGKQMAGAALVFQLLGILTIKKIVNIKV